MSGLVLSLWGGPHRRIRGLFAAMGVMSLSLVLMGIGRGLHVWAVAGFFFTFFAVMASGCSDAFWQSKVAPDVQGRVFSARAMIAQVARPVSIALAGPVADTLFEPSMMQGGHLGAVFGTLLGSGAGSGMSLMFVLAGLMGAGIVGAGYTLRFIREAEEILPDHEAI